MLERKTVGHSRTLAFLFAVAALAGCSSKSVTEPPTGNSGTLSSQSVPVRSAAFLALPQFAQHARRASHGAVTSTMTARPDAGASYVYGCAFYGEYCNVYSAKTGSLLGSVTGLDGPQGTMADAKGIWYITNTYGSDVLVFSPGGGSQINTLTDPNELPGDVAVSKKAVAVSNFFATSSMVGSVSVYLKGMTSPTYTLSYPGAGEGIGIAFDLNGNCYWSFNGPSSSNGDIVEFPKCSKKKAPIDLHISLTFAGGLAFDRNDDMWYIDQASGLFKCIGVSSCTNVSNVFADAVTINFNKKATILYLMDTGFGIYTITGLDAMKPHRVQPDYIVTPFVAIPASDGPVGVAAGPGI